ncbi:diguanylate cyclase with PAS/PAC sensor [Citrifermentans bremense]|uniref:Diguanylate cyclase with PAS/PAC sensor n=1 Tax=Citrifermentans bremense TaxID=60035 RepID=A0A6S6LZC2_9BACT|nr:diguanylate cyclase [Citrifermentans bremense]BCG45316.1 diguanylate cyclase with PAS/PAC sensor [Citrifermentans bremense]
MPRCSLKIKMSLVVFLLIGTVSSSVAGLGLLFFMREFKESIASRQFSVVGAMAGELDEKILAAQRELVAVAMSIPAATAKDAAAMQNFLDERLDLHQVFSDGTAFFSPKGRLLAFSPGQSVNIGGDFSKKEYLVRALQSGKALISDPFPSQRSKGHQVVMFTVPVLGEGGRIIGVLGGRVDLMEENFLSRVAHRNLGDAGEFFLFNQQRQMIAHRKHDRISKPISAKGQRELLDRAIEGFEGSGEMPNPSGSLSIYSFKRLPSRGWILAAERPLSEAYAPIYRAQKLVAWSLSLLLPLALITVWLFVGRLTAPLQVFAGRVRETGGDAGKYLPVPVQGRDEIGDLAQAFNAMMQELVINRRALEAEKGFAVQLLQHSAVPCFVIDAEHRVIIWNRAMEELTGFTAKAQVGLTEPWRAFYDAPRRVLADIVIEGTLYEMADLYSCYADSPLIPEGLRAEGWYRLKGKQKYLAFEAASIRDVEGKLIAAIQTMQDMTLRANTEEQLRGMVAAIGESEERFRRLVELSLDGIAILVERRFVFVNPAGCEMLGFHSGDELVGKEMREFIQRDSEQLFLEQVVCAEETGTTAPWIEERLLRQDRTAVEVELGVGPFVFRGEKALQVIFRDITERKLAKARLETLAHYDSLTSLPNRVLFFDRLRHAVCEAKRYKHALALMFLDLDSFKQINDRLGHAAGDAVLVEAGYRLRECVRACDMVARMGGDEFTIILTKMADQRDAALVAERVLESFALPFLVEGESAQVGVSIGICVYPDCDTDLDGMVRYADYAMYRAKQEGKNVYRFHCN